MNKHTVIRNSKPSQNIKSILKAIDILSLLSNDTRKLTEISRKLKISKSTVHRLLNTLKEGGLVIQDPINLEYHPGPLLFDIASNSMKIHQYLIYTAYPYMDDLRNTVGETVSLDIKYGMEKLKLKQLDGLKNIAFVGKPMILDQIWSGASGKVILAQLPENELNVILDNIKLTPLTSRTITDKQAFEKEILKVKERGYSTSISETEEGVAAIAAPIKQYLVPASIAFIGPEDRITSKIMDNIDILKAKAKEITEILKKNVTFSKM